MAQKSVDAERSADEKKTYKQTATVFRVNTLGKLIISSICGSESFSFFSFQFKKMCKKQNEEQTAHSPRFVWERKTTDEKKTTRTHMRD